MANSRRRPIAPVRKLISAVLGTFAAFVILFGAGMRNWAIVALGVALLVLAIGIVAVTAMRGGARTWVSGIAHVHSVSEPPASSKFGRCELQIVIDAPGLPPRSVKVREPRVAVDKWPRPGTVLPIMVAFDDQRHVRIIWDDVLTHAEANAEADGGLGPDYDPDPLADEVLIEQQAPPWAQRDPDDDFLPPADDLLTAPDDFCPPSDPDPTIANSANEPRGSRDEPVLLRQTPSGGIVLEGTLVDSPAVVPLPRQPDAGPPDNGPPDNGSADSSSGTGAEVISGLGEPATPPSTNHVGLTLLVADLNRSLAFYRDRLGFVQVDGGEGNVVLTTGGTRVVLCAVPDAAPVTRRLVHLNLEVDDVEASYEELRSHGVRFTYAPRMVNRGAKLEQWAAAFRDPDGHGIALTQWRSR